MRARKTGCRAVASRDASGGPAPRHRPLPAGDQLLNLVVDGDRRLPLRLVAVVAEAGPAPAVTESAQLERIGDASTGTLTRCLPARHENVLQALLCTTMWITCPKTAPGLCAHGEMLGIVLPGRAPVDSGLHLGERDPRPGTEKRAKLSTRHAAGSGPVQ